MLAATRADGSARNLILAAAPREEAELWLPEAELLELHVGQTLYRAGGRIAHLHFPVDAVVAVLGASRGGASVGVALVGREGFAGVTALLVDAPVAGIAVVQCAGSAYRLDLAAFAASFHRSQALRAVVLRYLASLVAQIAHTGICNAHHSVVQRLCRWLLQTLARTPSRELHLTQDLIAQVLGVRRESVSVAALELQNAGALRYRRGEIEVLSRELLESLCCECYAELRADFEGLERDVRARASSSASHAR
jgi:CRP-like cAMP-binding protein